MSASSQPKPGLGGTWPLFTQEPAPAFSSDPRQAVTPYRPDRVDLASLEQREDLPETTPQAETAMQRLRSSQPPQAPDWVRAARAMIDWLQARVEDGQLSALEEATISRTWAAFSLIAVPEPTVLRVAHLVSRAHHAIRLSGRNSADVQAAILDCAGVLHKALPSVVRDRMPIERVIQIVRRIKNESDSWPAVVEGTSELLGWKDYARGHAAAVIHALIERSR